MMACEFDGWAGAGDRHALDLDHYVQAETIIGMHSQTVAVVQRKRASARSNNLTALAFGDLRLDNQDERSTRAHRRLGAAEDDCLSKRQR
jgi:hypothetical protein